MGGTYLKNNQGFTLIEAIILVIIVSIFLSAVLPFTIENLTATARSKKRLQVYEAAHAKTEDLRHQSFASLTSGSFTPAVPGTTGQVTISGVDLNGDSIEETDIVNAKIEVNYSEKGATKTLTINTLITKSGLIDND
jgi:type II secretory pathway pseudopilin PulG